MFSTVPLKCVYNIYIYNIYVKRNFGGLILGFENDTVCSFYWSDGLCFAGTKALQDAGLSYNEIEQACCGYVYGMTVALHFNNDNNNSGHRCISPTRVSTLCFTRPTMIFTLKPQK